MLWNDTAKKRAYENTGIASYVEKFEQGMAAKTVSLLIKELDSPISEIISLPE